VNGQVDADIIGVGRVFFDGDDLWRIGRGDIAGMYGLDFQAVFRCVRHRPDFFVGMPTTIFDAFDGGALIHAGHFDYLLRNREILATLMGNSVKETFDRLLLTRAGFRWEYCTGIYLNKEQKMYRLVFDYAWMEFSDQKILVVRKKTRAVPAT
jgi:hypothetical protein